MTRTEALVIAQASRGFVCHLECPFKADGQNLLPRAGWSVTCRACAYPMVVL